VWAFTSLGLTFGRTYAFALFAVNVVLLIALMWGLDRNRIIWGQRLQREGRV
jgi:hypothetical protein